MHEREDRLVRIDWRPSRASLRSFGVALLIVLLSSALARGQRVELGSVPRDPIVVGCATFALLVAGLAAFRPEWLRMPYVALGALTYPARWLMAFLSLALLYYGLITPIAVCVRLLRRQRARSGQSDTSAWIAPRARRDKSHYFRQF